MLNIKEALQLTKKEELEAEMNERKELIKQMIGSLYPSILTDEVIQLYRRKVSLFGEDYSFRSRGIGCDSVNCFVCGKGGLNSNIAAFVKSKIEGEQVVQLFSQGAWLDFRPHEPSWIQVKIGACKEHLPSLELLHELTKDLFINKKKVDDATEMCQDVLKRSW